MSELTLADEVTLDPSRTAMLIQDLQNDVIIDGGAFAESGSPQHAKDQNVVANVADLAAACRAKGIPVIHVWYIVEDGAPGLKLNAPLFNGVKDTGALVRGSWGAAPADGLEAQAGDYVVEKMRMSAWQGTRLENLLAGLGRDTIIVTGAWTNMSIEHTSRTGADKGFNMIVPEDGCSTMNADWHKASINYALQNVAQVTSCAAVKAAIGLAREDTGRALPRSRRAARGRRARPRGARPRRRRRPHGGGRHLRHRPAPGQGRVAATDADGARPRGRRHRRGRGRRGDVGARRGRGRPLLGALLRAVPRLRPRAAGGVRARSTARSGTGRSSTARRACRSAARRCTAARRPAPGPSMSSSPRRWRCRRAARCRCGTRPCSGVRRSRASARSLFAARAAARRRRARRRRRRRRPVRRPGRTDRRRRGDRRRRPGRGAARAGAPARRDACGPPRRAQGGDEGDRARRAPTTPSTRSASPRRAQQRSASRAAAARR